MAQQQNIRTSKKLNKPDNSSKRHSLANITTIGISVLQTTFQASMMMKFLHPKGPSEKLFWLQRDDVCWISIVDVYCEVDAHLTGSTGRFYCFGKKTMQKIESSFN